MFSLGFSASTPSSTLSDQHIRPKPCLSLDVFYSYPFFIQIDWRQHKVVREAPWSTDPDEMVKHLQDWAEGWRSPVDSKPSDVWRCLLFRGRDRRIQVAYGTATSKDGESMSRHVKARRLCWMRLMRGQGQGRQKLQHPAISPPQMRTGVREARSPHANSHREEVQWHLDVAWLAHVAAVCTVYHCSNVPLTRLIQISNYHTQYLTPSTLAMAISMYHMCKFLHDAEDTGIWRFCLKLIFFSVWQRVCLVNFTRLPAMARHSCTPSGKSENIAFGAEPVA